MINDTGKSINEQTAEMVRANLKVSEEILQSTLKIRKYIAWIKILNIIKILLIVIPILLGFMFLSPYLKSLQSAFGVYGELLGVGQDKTNTKLINNTSQTPQDILQQIQELKNNGDLEKLLNQ